MRPEGKGRDQQYETIYGNAASQHSSRLIRVVSRKQQKDRSASDRINDRKQRAHHQENTLGNLNDQVNLPSASRFEASRLVLSPDRGPLAPRQTLRD